MTFQIDSFPALTKKVVFADRLVEIEFDPEDDTERDKVDAFWSSIFFAGLSDGGRYSFSHIAPRILGYEVDVAHANEDDQSMVVEISSWIDESDIDDPGEASVGPTVSVHIDIHGGIETASPMKLNYSPSMRGHVSRLLAQAALTSSSLDEELRELLG